MLLHVTRPHFLRRWRALPVGALLAASFMIASTRAGAATPLTPYVPVAIQPPTPQAFAAWGQRMAGAALPGPGGAPAAGGDLNGDGVPDVWVTEPSVSLPDRTGRIYALDGKAMGSGQTRVLYAIANPRPDRGTRFPTVISTVGDVDGDGLNDVAAGAEFETVNGVSSVGEAWTFSGRDGHLIRSMSNPDGTPRYRFGGRVGRAGDVTGDGVPDVLVAAAAHAFPTLCDQTQPLPDPCSLAQGQAYIFDGATGGLVRTLEMPAEDVPAGGCRYDCNFGNAVQGPGDVDGDGVPDQLVDASQYKRQLGRMYLFSGKTGALIRRIDSPEPQAAAQGHFGATFGFQDVAPLSPGDVNHDGFADVYGGAFAQNGPAGMEQGKAWVFDGRTGAVLYVVNDPTPERGGQFGWSMAGTDYNHDGTPDLYVGESPHDIANPAGCSFDTDPHCVNRGTNGGTAVFDGRNGTPLKTLELPPPYNACPPVRCPDLLPALGWSVAAPGDLNADGEPDYVAGAPFAPVGGNDSQGVVIAFLSLTCTSANTVSGTVNGPLVLGPGQHCVNGANVKGSILVQAGAAVSFSQTTVGGNVDSNGASSFTLCGSRVSGGLKVTNGTGPVLIGDPTIGCGPNTVAGPTLVDTNGPSVRVSANSFGRGLAVNRSSGPAGAGVVGNRIVGGLSCAGGDPPPTNNGRPNSVLGPRTGQCSAPGF